MTSALSHVNDSEDNRYILLLANSIRERDIETYDHSRRVANYAQRFARFIGWSKRDARQLALGALLHDLGKTWIANDILLKTDALTDEEMKTMERHPLIGARIMIGIEIHPFYVETVLYNHERWNGRGYPSGLHGEDIPLSARIVTVVDIYDILTAQSTSYNLLSKDEVRERLLMISGSLLDPTLVQAFLALIDTAPDFELPKSISRLPNHTRHHQAVHHSPFPIGI